MKRRPAIICSKHQSAWETFFFANGLEQHVCFVFKQELLLIPFFGWGIKLLRMIHINRTAGKKSLEQIIQAAPEQFELNRWIVFFPEGTRTLPGEKKRYKTGAAVLSKRLDVPIIPIAHNSGMYWKKNAWIKKPGTIKVKIGPPISPKNNTPEEIIIKARVWIETNS
jgi:1-acyl-sn-glycerol-3-phosphate acyltransferase